MTKISKSQDASEHPGGLPFKAQKNRNKNAETNDPTGDILDSILARGEKSKTFKKLLSDAGINKDNIHAEVSMGSGTETNPFSRKITLAESDGVDQNVLGLAHELTNRKNSDVLKKNILDVRKKIITPEVFADTILKIESEGIVNQIIVASETGINYAGTPDEVGFMNDLVAKYTDGSLKRKDVEKEIDKNLKDAVTDDGTSARDKYIQDGKDYQGN